MSNHTLVENGFALSDYLFPALRHHHTSKSGRTMNMEMQSAFRALADPTRRQILMHLSKSDMTIGEVSDRFDMTRGAVKKHLVILKEGNLISVHPKGRERINRLEPMGLKSVSEWLQYFNQFWDAKLTDLKSAIENDESNKGSKQ